MRFCAKETDVRRLRCHAANFPGECRQLTPRFCIRQDMPGEQQPAGQTCQHQQGE
jgi:hypothetical protein